MKTTIILFFKLLLLFVATVISAQTKQKEVLTLGTFHFAFHNRDVKKVDQNDQIDVLDKKYQDEIHTIVQKILKFRPTIIAVEVDPALQPTIDSLYQCYLEGNYELNREEYQQIGFRTAKKLNLKKIYCVNDWGHYYKNIDSLLANDANVRKKFNEFFYKNPDTSLIHYSKDIFKTKGIIAQLKELNNPKNLKKDLGNYLVGTFKYETESNHSFGVDFTTGWWFNRNLKIFRNIQKINTNTSDKILVIYGAGHMNLLNIFFNSSPEYKLQRINKYLK
ncbi:DUF5694 domain-containing protein [Chryseobacterium nakagawai]|uniref:DUF5694 domain-containing protein n=1 Tax=Chryseobacterium nakagawai TaxID=1241982 RepID=UPI0018E08BC0|nr:DUF5694 domain-containing protein [Chryseobacterium nakagawai]